MVRDAGPEALTFAAAAAESGLAASTLVQRFGSKAGLLRAALLRAWDLLDERDRGRRGGRRARPGRAWSSCWCG